MDCNVRSPLQWDWENLFMLNCSQTQTHRKQLPNEWEFEKGEGIESVVPSFSDFDGASSASGSNFWHAALSKSSQSASVNSLLLDIKTSKSTSDNREGIPGEFSSDIEFAQPKASPAFDASAGSDEPLLVLKLGKRTYFEDVFGGNSDEGSTVTMNLTSSVTLKKPKLNGQSIKTPRCQVEGCNLDLSSAKDYHRKHRVCESHSKCLKVIVGSLEHRFCQQCSRFHALSEFDEKKRSCRKRLSHHNARRRKPQPGAFPLNPARIYDGRQHTSLVWNRLSLNTTAEEKFPWECPRGMKPTQTEGYILSFPKAKGIKEQLHPSSSQPMNSRTGYPDANGSLPGKTNIISFQVPNKGVEDLSASSGFGFDETQDFDRALSLLSTTSWDSCQQPHAFLGHHTNNPEPPVQQCSSLFQLFSYDHYRN